MASMLRTDIHQPLYRTWAIATGIGPLVGGGLAQIGQWRWLFCMSDYWSP